MKYGLLTVLGDAGSRGGRKCWLVECGCGQKLTVIARDVRNGHTKSCGCLRGEPYARKHGHAKDRYGRQSREYTAWVNMKGRCSNPNAPSYAQYGGRGIAVCERWQSFANFIEDMGPSTRHRFSLDRIDPNRNYEPGNCRWASRKTQGENKRSTRWITHRGETLSISGWSRRLGLSHETLRSRIERGMPLDRAIRSNHYVNQHDRKGSNSLVGDKKQCVQ